LLAAGLHDLAAEVFHEAFDVAAVRAVVAARAHEDVEVVLAHQSAAPAAAFAAFRSATNLSTSSRIALTTDQTSAAGSPPGTYALSGRAVISDGRVVRLEDGTLAGSAATMPDLVRLMARLPGVGVAHAISLASAVPAKVLGENRLGRIHEGACADLIVLDPDLRVRLTIVRGVVKFRRPS